MNKKFLISALLFLPLVVALPACGDGDGDGDSAGDGDGDGSACADRFTTDTALITSVDADITTDTTWTCDTVYRLDDFITVSGDAVLTIEPGTTVRGTDGSALVFLAGSRLEAVGTEDNHIVFTADTRATAPGSVTAGDWGGVVLIGSAPSNCGSACTAEGFPGGSAPSFGGSDAASNCGTLEYVSVQYAGNEVTPGNELNGITWYGCGTGTSASFVQSHQGSDDGMEWFGGGFDADHLVVTGAQDDSFDIDLGFTGDLQFLFAHQSPTVGDNGYEISNNPGNFAATPVTSARIANSTVVGSGSTGPDSTGVLYKEQTHGALWNSLMVNFNSDKLMDIQHQETCDAYDNGDLVVQCVLGEGSVRAVSIEAGETCNDTELLAIFDAAGNNNSRTETATTLGLDGTWEAPNIQPSATGPAADAACTLPTDGAFDASGNDYHGAVDPLGTDWTQAAWIEYAE